ncbi:CAP domain-containing protein [Streptomyces sp. NPDC026206]|uniref:CAP domain-containing protein n=1 Tax=Streptomyces sp. NPDC026206 TaxID=3157089 RepID=UPI0033EB24F8
MFEFEDPAEAVTQPLPVIGSGPAGSGRHRSPHRPKRSKAGAAGTAAGKAARSAGRTGKPAKAAPPARRAGLLGASAAVAMGAVAVVSGLLPSSVFSVGDAGHSPGAGATGQVRADGPAEAPQQRSRAAAAPADRADQREGPEQRAGAAEAARVQQALLREPVPAARGAEPPPVTPSATPFSAAPSAAPAGPHAGATPQQGAPAPRPADAAPRPRPSAPTAAATGAAAADDGPAAHMTATLADPRSSAAHLVLSLVNAERAKAGCRPLRASGKLNRLAQSFSDDMARRGFFDHTDPDGRTPWDRAAKRGVQNLGGENIARGHPDAHTVVDAWMRSSGHRSNILNCDYKSLGVGVRHGGNGPYWTQDFGY